MAATDEPLRRRRALVTGASRGIGAAIARALARDGLDVVLNCKSNVALAEKVADEIRRESDAVRHPIGVVGAEPQVRALGRVAAVKAFDVRDAAATARAIEEVLAEGSVDVLVNNAGITRDAPFPALSADAWNDVLGTTLDGFYNVTRPLVMPMVQRRWGRIINLSSISGLIGNRGQVSYAAAKAGLVGATRALSFELAKRNITVNAVAPGLIETDMIKDAPVEELMKHVPMRRLGRVDEVADLVAFLASDRAAYITGQVIGISGGLG